jgi:hypothetical protein
MKITIKRWVFFRKEFIVFFLLSLFLVNCSDKFDDYYEVSEPALSIEKARSWFETNLQPVINGNLIKPKTDGSPVIDLQPLFNWNLAELFSNSNWAVVELPWEYEEGTVTYSGEGEGLSSGNDPTEPNQIIKLVILSNLATEEIYGFKMVVLPDNDYLALGGDLSSTTYLNQDSQFSGLILFYSVIDQFVNGWKYENGLITGSLTTNESIETKEGEETSSNIIGYYIIETCWYQYSILPDGTETEHILLGCNVTYHYITAFYDDGGGGGGGFDPNGGGSGSGGGPGRIPYQLSEGDTFFKDSVTTTMDIQVLNSCLFAIMEYVSQELCGLLRDITYFNNSYFSEYGEWALFEGVNSQNAMPFLRKHFRSRPFVGFQDAINNGRVVIIDTPVPGQPGITHAIAIVGYKSNGRLIFMDPAKGQLWEGPPTGFGISFVFAARGCL